ncbi:hypothetical protein [Streptomyces sp. NPDC126503]|uniref:hypothetical protein n=1 Tax=Streptomyces sp. NPDC126503 TaxID=3155315 RepID=UPI003321F5C7
MNHRTAAAALALTALGTPLATAGPAAAGGIGNFLSPAFGTSCANLHTGAHADGVTAHGTGTVGGNLAGLPISDPFSHCGGAELGAAGGVIPMVGSLMGLGGHSAG